MALSADDIADLKIIDIRAYLNYFTDKLMSNGRRHLYCFLCPGVPVIYMQVGTANPTSFNPDHHIIDAHLWLGHILDPKALFGLTFYECFHQFGIFAAVSLNNNKAHTRPLTCNLRSSVQLVELEHRCNSYSTIGYSFNLCPKRSKSSKTIEATLSPNSAGWQRCQSTISIWMKPRSICAR